MQRAAGRLRNTYQQTGIPPPRTAARKHRVFSSRSWLALRLHPRPRLPDLPWSGGVRGLMLALPAKVGSPCSARRAITRTIVDRAEVSNAATHEEEEEKHPAGRGGVFPSRSWLALRLHPRPWLPGLPWSGDVRGLTLALPVRVRNPRSARRAITRTIFDCDGAEEINVARHDEEDRQHPVDAAEVGFPLWRNVTRAEYRRTRTLQARSRAASTSGQPPPAEDDSPRE